MLSDPAPRSMVMGWSRPEYAHLAALIAERTGLTFPASRQQDMERALHDVRDEPLPPERLRELLAADTAARDELIASLTVGESYFFRDTAQFQVLREEILPGLAALRGDGPLRLWSAGCAAGEEAYSLGMVSEQLGLRDRASVLGSDLSRVRLAAARRALYTKWALRGLDGATIDRYFIRSGGRYALRPAYRENVDFRYLNLAEDRYPSLSAGIWGFDVILCRNVLIYFDAETTARVARRLLDSLSEDGWLMLGASDPPIDEYVDCQVVLTRAGLLYRRSGTRTVPLRAPEAPAGSVFQPQHVEPADVAADTDSYVWTATESAPDEPAWPFLPEQGPGHAQERAAAGAQPVPDVPDDVRAAYAARDYARAALLAERHLHTMESEPLRVLRVRALANRGELHAAGHAVAAALDHHHASAELLYLHALLLLEGRRWHEAATAARRALYLDRTLVVAHLTLAQALRRAGDVERGRRALRNAAALLADTPADAVVPASDGETAARLRTRIDAQLRVLAVTN